MLQLTKIFAASMLVIVSVLGLNLNIQAQSDTSDTTAGPAFPGDPSPGDSGVIPFPPAPQSIPESSPVSGLILLGCLGASLSAHKHFIHKK